MEENYFHKNWTLNQTGDRMPCLISGHKIIGTAKELDVTNFNAKGVAPSRKISLPPNNLFQ